MHLQLQKHHERYSSYKNTGVPWLGDVPENWKVNQLKRLTKYVSRGNSPEYSDDETDHLVLNQACIYWDGLHLEKVKYHTVSNFSAKKGLLKRFDLVMNSTGTGTLGRVAMVVEAKNMIADGHVTIIRCNKDLHPRFLLNLLSTGLYQGFIYSYCVSGATNQIELSGSRLVETPVVLPLLECQIAIAKYLDEKTALIERIIKAKQKQIELLKENRSALINRAVTKGIRRKVMFDTNAFDQWQKLSKEAQEKLLEQVEIIYTHIQEDELPSALQDILPSAKKTHTSGAIYDVSKWDDCTWGADVDSENINTIVGNGKREKHSRDALIANTAQVQNYLLITDDQRLQKKCNEIDVEAISFDEFSQRFRVKESGIDWIGKIKNDWSLKKLKYIAHLKSGEAITSELIEDTGTYPVYGGNGVRGYTSDFTHNGRYVLIGRQGALCGNVNYADGRFWASEHAVVANILDGSAVIWLGELVRIMDLNQYSISAAQPGLSVDRVKNLIIPSPPHEEQKKIVEYLRVNIQKIDSTLKKIHQSISLLQEYKISIVSNVVTGKIKVA